MQNEKSEPLVSIVAEATATECTHRPLSAVLAEIRSDAHKAAVAAIRSEADKKKRSVLKKKLPGAIFAGTFSTRRADAVETRSGILVLDVDDVGDAPALRDRLAGDRHVRAAFVSPSGAGIKIVMPTGERAHGDAYRAAEVYLRNAYGAEVDPSGKDICRMCFLSHDPDMVENTDATAPPDAPGEKTQCDEPGDGPWDSGEVRELLRHIPTHPPYDLWLRIASAVWSVVGMEEGCRLLAEWSPEDEPGEYAAKYRHRLERIGPGTLVHIAKENGYAPVTGRTIREWANGDARDKRIEAFVKRCAADHEAGNAHLFAVLGRGRWLRDKTGGDWMRYAGDRWVTDERQSVRIQFRDWLRKCYGAMARRLAADVQAAVESGALQPKEVANDPREVARKNCFAALARLNKRQTIQNSLDLAGDHLACTITDFDADPDLFNFEGGAVDLKSGNVLPSDPRHLCRHRANAGFDPQAACPKWREFVDTICCGDRDLARYLQKLVGLTVSGRTGWDFLALCIGGGSNGKSTFFETIKRVLGDYAHTLSVEMLLQQKHGRDSVGEYEKCNLLGARLAVASEMPPGRKLNESLVKDLTGCDIVTARQPYGRPFAFEPTHKIFLFGNTTPRIDGTDNGIWRRVKLLPFHHRFPAPGEPGNRTQEAVRKELMEERHGILLWLVEGYRMATLEGVEPPLCVVEATTEYRDDSDPLQAFIRDRCEVSPHLSVPRPVFHDAVQTYCEEKRHRRFSPVEIRAKLEEIGCKVKTVSGVRFYEGIPLCQ